MCHHCVIDSVKQSMLSRRSFFTGVAAAAAAGADQKLCGGTNRQMVRVFPAPCAEHQ